MLRSKLQTSQVNKEPDQPFIKPNFFKKWILEIVKKVCFIMLSAKYVKCQVRIQKNVKCTRKQVQSDKDSWLKTQDARNVINMSSQHICDDDQFFSSPSSIVVYILCKCFVGCILMWMFMDEAILPVLLFAFILLPSVSLVINIFAHSNQTKLTLNNKQSPHQHF